MRQARCAVQVMSALKYKYKHRFAKVVEASAYHERALLLLETAESTSRKNKGHLSRGM